MNTGASNSLYGQFDSVRSFMMLVIFWFSYFMLLLGVVLWVAKHPLRVGGSILFLYISGRVLVGFAVRFIVGVFLFLTGVRGIMVAFLYVVALCPNPVFSEEKVDIGYG